jgi:diguanylate cyclase (GGDEF)-like protein
VHLPGLAAFLWVLGVFLGGWFKIVGDLRKRPALVWAIGVSLAAVLFLAGLFYLRDADVSGSYQTYLYVEVGGTLLSFCYAANALVRFRGTHDRTALILSFGFVLSGLIETVGYFQFNHILHMGGAGLHIPLGWMVSRTLLAVLLLAALGVEKYTPTARQPGKEIAIALLVVALAAYTTSAAFLAAPSAPIAHPTFILSRAWDLLPAFLFFVAAVAFFLRIKKDEKSASVFEYSLFLVASMNVVCHIAAAFSRHLLDGPFFFAELSKTASYVVMLFGAMLDQARLFDQVRTLAVSDSLTGLANYRRLLSVMEAELDRSRRTQRPFSVVLFDMDGLKSINDQYGHLTGSRALVRLGRILRNHCRAIDTAARYGGDEFAIVFPEADSDIATRIVNRIHEKMSSDAEAPALSASAGTASYPADGDTPEKLLAAADRALYRMKHRGSSSIQNLSRIAACL